MVAPEFIVVGPYRYRLRLDKKAWRKRAGKVAEMHSVRGMTSTAKHVMWIDTDGNSLDVIKETVVHELIHALFDDAGITWPVAEEEQEETLIRVLSPRLFAALKVNPELLAWLSE